ncbi:phage antirepressor [Pediococcus acidilactici]|uniref:phage antirepressor n=1 Tax=Pediococcus acidilactici TaxID=1254 RepID=UPI00132A26F3|nr:phage antirepressor [Pediococcus acidilactici]KAF0336855.1 phage antirepressor protein [Pediococcus acidilactici]KAF0348460.1 phage antirepressor protein [Pediococcus acidilactici]KAF0462106.1 phage antirepressor protein [Pediococcus acidilactici]KAF0502972.1 phage antirepressor protein [Pediococcus acidilactici]KAF0512173.1 phage antirepressor protein [Pediococcus acidilactici]
MNGLQNFNFEGNEVRTVLINDEPYFVGKDVADVLGYENTSKAIRDHVDEEDKMGVQNGTPSITDSLGRNQKPNWINESGVYSLIWDASRQSKNKEIKQKASQFKRWVTNEVLPSIRKHGAYMTDEKIEEALLNPDTIISLATKLKAEREGRLIAEQQVKEFQPKVSYYDKVLSNDALMTISLIAKDYGMSGAGMNKLLHKLGVQYRQGGTWLLYAKYQRTGWTHSETKMVPRKDGTEKAVLNTKWTQKGRLGLYELLKDNGYLPLIEQEDETVM